jgi:hypothetical protein
MVHPKIQNMLLLCAVAASSDRHRAHSLAVSYPQDPTALLETDTQNFVTSIQPTTTIFPINNTKAVSSQGATITTSSSKHTGTSDSEDSTAGADAVRASTGARDWSTILNMVLTALLGLASIVVAVILGRKQLQAMRVQLQLMLDVAHGHPLASHVEMDDLERGQHDPDLDGNRNEVRPEISSAVPAVQRADPSNDFTGFLPEPQPHVVDDDLPTHPVIDHEQGSIQPRQLQLPCGDNSPQGGVEPREGEGQTPEDTSTASGCSHLGRQDFNGLNLDDPKSLHVDDRESHLPTIAGISIH